MEEKSEQINIRASQRVARELRAEAQRRGLPLGETLEQLLALARAEHKPGAWVDLDVEGERALACVAAAEGLAPATQLARMAKRELRSRLLELAASLKVPESKLADSQTAAAASVDSLLLHARDSGGALPGPKSLKRPATSSAGDSQRAQSAEASDNDDEELDRVGIFSVFE